VITISKHRGEGWELGAAGWYWMNCGCSGHGWGNGLCKFMNVVCKDFDFSKWWSKQFVVRAAMVIIMGI